MPLGSVLATPFQVTTEDLERTERRRQEQYGTHFNRSDSQDDDSEINHVRNDTLLGKQAMLRVKCFELVTTILSLVLFIVQKSKSQCVNVDLLISGFFGTLLMYPIMVLSIPNHDELGVFMMLFNLISSLMLFTSGYFMFSSWYDLKNTLMADALIPLADLSDKTDVATFQFSAATCLFIIGTIYASEVFIQIIDNIRRIF